jgi:Cys-tRNA(Pro) deacylase
MSRTPHAPETPATTFLRSHNVNFTEHLYDYVEHGGTAESAKQLGVNEHEVVKTLVMQDQDAKPLLVLMHGDLQVGLKTLARQTGAKKIDPCKPDVAQRHTGYMVGGTSPFGTRKPLPVYVERTILELPAIYINGGHRGFLVRIQPQVLTDLLAAIPVEAAAV